MLSFLLTKEQYQAEYDDPDAETVECVEKWLSFVKAIFFKNPTPRVSE